jgi:Beta-propeller repeat
MKHIITSVLLAFVLSACGRNPSELSQQPLVSQDLGTVGFDTATGVAANARGVFVVGSTYGSLDGPNKGSEDAFIRRYDGGTVWAQQFGTRSDDYASGVAVDSAGNSYVLGGTFGALGFKVGKLDTYLRKYNLAGVLQWTRQFGTIDFDDEQVDIEVDATGNIYTLNTEGGFTPTVVMIRKWNSSGALLLTIPITDRTVVFGQPRALALDSTGNIYMLAQTLDGTNVNVTLYKYTSAGVAVAGFPKRLYASANADIAFDLKLDSTNNLYITFRDSGTGITYLRKCNSSVVTQWTKGLEPTNVAASFTSAIALAVDSAGNIYVGGYTTGAYTGFTNTDGGFYDIFAMKYNSAGTRLWTQQFGAGSDDLVTDIAVSDGLYIVGQSQSDPNLLGDPGYGGQDAFLAKLNVATGAVLGIDQ